MFARPRTRKTVAPPPKRKKTEPTIEEVNFNFDAREEYLTGFHKRKVQRQKWAQDQAAKREKDEKLQARKQIRQERAREVEEHVQSINKLLQEAQAANSDDDQEIEGKDFEEWDGIEETHEKVIDFEDEYIDEDKFTTVKVEAVSVSRDGFEKIYDSDNSQDKEEDEEKDAAEKTEENKEASKKKEWPKKQKAAKFRYEQKFDRQNEAKRQRAKKRAKFKGKE
ncbi:nucleolar protein 12-domain-containing protein [Plectosphaerella plurivora]|uniref:Nucleolar protein 12-domain-containing protein n=1 Tax=Plectosphaerella plurivora TaxID=936078 RepID=A0A9P9AA00_9PEZI|nr:nucleolar protein 12-domain-containing protein [Plectosphaerella plurivora]